MLRLYAPFRRRTFALAASSSIAMWIAWGLAACVLAEPATELPQAAHRRPTILNGSAAPPTNAVLGTMPREFVVLVELSDPFSTFSWALFVDYNPVSDPGPANNGTSSFGTENVDERSLRILRAKPGLSVPDIDHCHVIELVVAEVDAGFPQGTHSPPDLKSDSITWFYSPGGDMAGCPGLDASTLIDAGSEVEEGGPD
jgi:hypothetical protein